MENQKLLRILEQDYQFRFGYYISQGFKIFEKNIGGFVAFTILFLVISAIFSLLSNFIPYVPNLLNTFIIAPVLVIGFSLVAHILDKGRFNDFSDFFGGFKYLGQLILVTIATTLIGYLAAAPFFLYNSNTWEILQAMSTDQEHIFDHIKEFFEIVPIWSYLLILPYIYIVIAFSWAPFFVVFYQLDFWSAMETSRELITKKWFTLFLFSVVTTLILFAGFLGVCVGFLFTMPAIICMHYVAFADVTQLNLEEDDLEIADYFIDGSSLK